MKILYFFQELPSPMYQWQRVHIINELKEHGVIIETFNPLEFSSPVEANEKLLLELSKHKYDLFFTNVCYEKMLFPDVLQKIKIDGTPTMCLRCDNLVIPYQDKKLAPLFDLVWITAKETKYLYDEWGVNSFFAPYAANPYAYCYKQKQLRKNVCFIGTPYGSRSIMINAISKAGMPVDVYYGKNPDYNQRKTIDVKYSIKHPNKLVTYFDRLRFKEGRKLMKGAIYNKLAGQTELQINTSLKIYPSIMPNELSDYYSEYVLSLASTSTNHTDRLKHPLKIVNLRNFEIPMSGGIEICKYNPELAEYFEDGKEIVFYQDNDELVDKSRFYLLKATDGEISAIKFAARKRAETDHTWWCRFTKIFNILGLKY